MTFTQATTELKLQSGGFHTTKIPLTYSKQGDVVPTNTRLEIFFSPVRHDRVFFQHENDNTKSLSIVNCHKYLTGFNKPPGNRSLEKYCSDAIAKTPTGYRTEPDGFGQDHSPSWLLVLGLI